MQVFDFVVSISTLWKSSYGSSVEHYYQPHDEVEVMRAFKQNSIFVRPRTRIISGENEFVGAIG